MYSSLKGKSFRELRLISLCLSVLFDSSFAKRLLYEVVQKAMPSLLLPCHEERNGVNHRLFVGMDAFDGVNGLLKLVYATGDFNFELGFFAHF